VSDGYDAVVIIGGFIAAALLSRRRREAVRLGAVRVRGLRACLRARHDVFDPVAHLLVDLPIFDRLLTDIGVRPPK
jgi:hypothetical protein